MNILIKICKYILTLRYNKLHKVYINSLFASLKASYGLHVSIDKETRIAADVVIGDYTYVNRNSSLENCDIGKFCSISSGVYVSPYNHNLNGITTHPIGDYKRNKLRTRIGNDVLISLNTIVLEGVQIGDGAVIGAGAVVTHDVGPYEVWGGIPARFIHYRVEDDKQREALLNLKWWDMNDEMRERYIDKYRNSLDGIDKMEG